MSPLEATEGGHPTIGNPTSTAARWFRRWRCFQLCLPRFLQAPEWAYSGRLELLVQVSSSVIRIGAHDLAFPYRLSSGTNWPSVTAREGRECEVVYDNRS